MIIKHFVFEKMLLLAMSIPVSQTSLIIYIICWNFSRSCLSFAFLKPVQRNISSPIHMASALTRSTHLSNPIGCHETRLLYVLRERRVHEAPFNSSWFLRLLRYTSRGIVTRIHHKCTIAYSSISYYG